MSKLGRKCPKISEYNPGTYSLDYSKITSFIPLQTMPIGISDKESNLICPYCNRNAPNRGFFTQNGLRCIACDPDYCRNIPDKE